VPDRIADTITLSTFHGCPPDEIERMVEHLFERHALQVVVKLNPTLLGYEAVDELLHRHMGWSDVELDPAAFAQDLRWDDALALLERLRGSATRHGLSLGVKFTNTLVVKNTRGRLAGDAVYLSGPPLHVLAATLADRFARATEGRFPISFSAGICAENFADAVACGFAPVTTCTDLLQPTGYRRLPRYLKSLEADMVRVGAADLEGYVLARNREHGGRATSDPAEAARSFLAGYAGRVSDEPRYHGPAPVAPAARRPLAAIDCDACNNCVVVCPNLAFVALDVPPGTRVSGVPQWRDGEAWLPPGEVATTAERQYVLLTDACNECGNCDTHCPQEGGPFRVKPGLGGGF
jgi:putative selenate reductase